MATEVVRLKATVVSSQWVDLTPTQGGTSHGLQGKWRPTPGIPEQAVSQRQALSEVRIVKHILLTSTGYLPPG